MHSHLSERDPLEEMLVVQALWTHARLARLSTVANAQTGLNNVKVVHEACDKAACTFRRQMLALAEYRRPPRTDSFVAIKQTNVAQQQTVQNAENQNPKIDVRSNEKGLPANAARLYRLSPAGLQSLRQSIWLSKPWLKTQGPATPAGKAVAKMNALKHCDRTADRLAARREQWKWLQSLRAERGGDEAIDAITDIGSMDVWLDRIADEITGTTAGEMLRNAEVFKGGGD